MSKFRLFWYRKHRGQRITALMARDGANCTICGDALDRHIADPNHPRYITLDHIVPRSLGGLDALSNLRLAHQECNTRRGNDPVTPTEERSWSA
jgi:5-methylcytosine-specific restriction endonuclease McrA